VKTPEVPSRAEGTLGGAADLKKGRNGKSDPAIRTGTTFLENGKKKDRVPDYEKPGQVKASTRAGQKKSEQKTRPGGRLQKGRI